MTTVDHPRIALWCENHETRAHWESVLNQLSLVLVDWPPAPELLDQRELAGICSDHAIDIVCTDASSLVHRLEQCVAAHDAAALGLIVIDPSLATAASESGREFAYQPGILTRLQLPANVDSGTLGLICRLLSDHVRLRRQMQRAGERHQDLARQAMLDPLTELPNRRAWDDELSRRVSASEASQLSLALAIVDLDYFKQVNDEYGHTAGDATLRMVAKRLRQALRDCDFVARLGGDEFGVLLADVDREMSELIVERVRNSLSELSANASQPPITASAGVATRNKEHPLTEQQLSQAADRALLAAKRAGRRQTIVADDS